ncbi:MAG: pyruvate, phosphate dikinase, partial [Desulfobacteraceae bacterium]|nr:pyruvate, phosphate dikinase [Desulfobacteraceae bacterium]
MKHGFSLSDGPVDKNLLGNKGANLVSMTRQRLPVPPGFVLSIDAYRLYRDTGELPDGELEQSMAGLEQQMGKKLGEGLKVSVRSSAPVSMPGMMDTLLNVEDMEQVKMAIKQIFHSWDNPRAVEYRRINHIPPDLGTAAIVQAMVFGNKDSNSGTGVVFTRNPSTGEKGLFGEYLAQAQGEDIVSGARTPEPISALKSQMPHVYDELDELTKSLEYHYRDMQDVEFTIENKKLWMLQTRDGKRTAKSAVKIAVDMANEGLITREEAVLKVSPEQVDTLLHPRFNYDVQELARGEGRLYATGVNASPGAAVGQVYFDADTAERMAKENGLDVIMVRPFTKPDDVHGMLAAKGILTSEGGATSHAAVVARQFGVPCVVGAAAIRIDLEKRQMEVGDMIVKEGECLSVDGTTGEIFLGEIETIEPALEEQTDLLTLLNWADEITSTPGIRDVPEGWPTKGLQVWANADYPADAKRARSYGAVGIGLCRTEHMFFEQERLPVVQRMILADTGEERKAALDELLPHQRSDFEGLFEAMDGLPVIIRLIDPPLHEFLPSMEELLEEVITMQVKGEIEGLAEKEELLSNVQALHESNPMMGLRGIRLSIVMPEIVEMQVRAIFEAAANVTLKGINAKPEV